MSERSVPPPLIFTFQPSEGEEVGLEAERLAEWEKLTQQLLGFRIKINDSANTPLGTRSTQPVIDMRVTVSKRKDDCGMFFD